ncbi:unnamed protein product [Phytomonas sp. Hart1]|nr:unnamed protein product [Phytomonas sp. Hart1]|eukprot:CCW69129.1 unnamed protein product [Phytomonas sp. isolate Hart1]
MRCREFPYLKLTPFSGTVSADTATFPIKELTQRMMDYDSDVKRRRKIGVAIVNLSTHTVCVRKIALVNGSSWEGSVPSQVVESHTALLKFYTNQDWDPRGAEGYYILELRNTNDNPLVEVYYVRLQFEISALNKLGIAIVASPTSRKLRKMSLTPKVPDSLEFDVNLDNGLFFSLDVRIVKKFKTIQLRVHDFVERQIDNLVVQTQAKLTVGVCGYTTIFDPRRPSQDQQVALWKDASKDLSLVSGSETYVVQWEDEYLDRFGKSIDLEFDITDHVSKKAFGKVKGLIKKQLLQGSIFSGFRAFKSLMGSMYIPRYVIQTFSAIDNSYATLSNRAVFTGIDLAKALLNKNIGYRPVTLIGFSFGCKVVCECLLELHRVKALNLIDNVFLMGAMVPVDTDVWMQMREVAAGRLINLYTRGDWILWMMYRVNETDLKPMAGISPVNLPGIENIDVTPIVEKHLDYAFKLQDVLKLIPLQPTEETWSKKGMRGSPGVIMSLLKCEETMKNMGNSLVSIFSSTPFCVLSLLNNFVSDNVSLGVPLELLSSSLHNSFFDFRPPQSVPPLSAGVFGAIGESGVNCIGGAISYIVRLNEFSAYDIMLIIFFYVDKKSNPSMAVCPRLVIRQESDQESSEAAKKRLCTIASEAFKDLEEVRKICNSQTAMHASVKTIITQPVKVPMHSFFTDGHNQATVFIDLERMSDGISISVRALLTKTSSQPQQEHFTGEVFHSIYDNQLITAAGGEMPTVAEIYSIDELNNKLAEIALKLYGKQTEGRSKTKESDSIIKVLRAELPSVEPTIIPVVISNRSNVPLHFIEPEITSEDDSRFGDLDLGDVAEFIHPDVVSSPCLCAPPPTIPPDSFCVVIFRNSEKEPSFSVNYATAHGSYVFNIYTATPAEVTADIKKDPQLVKCNRLSGKDDKDSLSTSTTTVGDIVFHMVSLDVKTDEEVSTPTSFGNLSMSKLFDSNGWYIV